MEVDIYTTAATAAMTPTQEAADGTPAHGNPFTTSFGHNLSASTSSDTLCRYVDAPLAEERRAQGVVQAEGPNSHVPESPVDQAPPVERHQPFPADAENTLFGGRGRSHSQSSQKPVGYCADTSLSPLASGLVQSPLRSPTGDCQTANPSQHPGYFIPSRPSQARIAGHSGSDTGPSSLPQATAHMRAPTAAAPATVCRQDFNGISLLNHQLLRKFG